ncbi:putative methyltransferase-like protein 8 [Scophthalmus maximus]|uniref:Putative methyltransferase-like protein 8 n=1 Tax=Scophthalmus maximus TaxID=52904 RepID=A0A2U9C962_SCOMX|nr:putative methyltransferase-like protein 8 [Scophthalmus maximus]
MASFPFPLQSLDVIVAVFVLSSIHPERQPLEDGAERRGEVAPQPRRAAEWKFGGDAIFGPSSPRPQHGACFQQHTAAVVKAHEGTATRSQTARSPGPFSRTASGELR